MEPTVTGDVVEELFRAHKRAAKRIRRDAIPPGAQIGLAAFVVTSWALTGGAADAVGTAIGTHLMGLHGAAATSAGLAWLGGGSLASGGMGMAGGVLLVAPRPTWQARPAEASWALSWPSSLQPHSFMSSPNSTCGPSSTPTYRSPPAQAQGS